MKIKILLLMILLININISYSQNKGVDITVGKTYTLQSKSLKESREIEVYLPDGYGESDKEYPVLYILDGQKFYLYGVSLQRLFFFRDYTPDFIVVGILNSSPQRFRHFDSGAAEFINFIEKILILLGF